MKTVAITTLGCKTNQFETAAMAEQLQSSGYRLVPFNGPSDIYIVNSCTVTARTDAETRRLIRRARRLNPRARIVATGCYAQISPDELEKMPELDAVLGNREKTEISALLESSNHKISVIATEDETAPLTLSSFAEHTRAFLQVQNGCNSFCAYCIVPFARGRSRSVLQDDVLTGVSSIASAGFKEVVLTGIHLGSYGLDLMPHATLTELVQNIDDRRIIPRLRIGSIEPNEVTDGLLAIMSRSSSICPHLHLPLQCGSDSVLERMGRHYSAHFFRELLFRVTQAMPEAFIGVDVIAGFPGETDAEFCETVKLLEELPVSDLHVFPYSRRPGTRAAGMPGQLPPQVITARAARLREVARNKKSTFLNRFIGQRLHVLVQGINQKTGVARGISRNYISVTCACGGLEVNQEVAVRVLGSDAQGCSAEVVPEGK